MKKRILSLLLIFVLLAGMWMPMSYASDTGITEAENSDAACEICGKLPCECAPTGEVCPVCGKTPCECAPTEEVCPVCGKTPCECAPTGEQAVWDTVAEPHDICMIGYLDKSNNEIVLYDSFRGEKHIAASVCPEYLILTQSYPHKQSGEDVIYKTDSPDDNFYFETLSGNPYIEAKYFSTVVSAVGLYARLSPELPLSLYKDISTDTDTVSLGAAELSGEYLVEELVYADNLYCWFVKLSPDENWPEKAGGYVWVSAGALSSLSRTASPKPENHDCTCDKEGEVQYHDPDCALYRYWLKIYGEDMSPEQLSAMWPELDKRTRESILAILRDSCPEKLEELRALLPDMNHTVENSVNGVTVKLSGDIPKDVTLLLDVLAEERYNGKIYEYASEALPVYFALDVSPTMPDGSKWQPYEGENVLVTIDAGTLGLTDGVPVRLFNDHEGRLDELTTRSVEEGLLEFNMSAFSTVYGVATRGAAQASLNNVVYFDLNAGNIEINNRSYTGYRFDGGQTPVAVTGTLQDGESYYIYQSDNTNKLNTGIFINEQGEPEIRLPAYNRVPGWASAIFGETVVSNVIGGWESAAAGAGRSSTEHYAVFTGSMNCAVVIDNLWSSYQPESSKDAGSQDAAFKFLPGAGSTLTVLFKGDNRFGKIYYLSPKGSGSSIVFAGDNDATLTVANMPGKDGYNYWKSAIGADDSHQDADGIIINSGNIYAGTTALDDCTAIGGGGNGYGGITINGGTVTAVVTSSGAAIGGGIGKTANGGQAGIVINGGSVYAYNYSCQSTYSATGVNYIPAAAIGGGSSARAVCSNTEVIIRGGTVYARSVGGTAIGGGSSSDTHGGSSTIIIEGGYIDAASLPGNIGGQSIKAGAAIGGGTGGSKGNGGDCILRVSGGTLITGSIGGGKTLNTTGTNTIGSANVTISGGNIQGQIIMAKGAATDCSFKMSDGTIDNAAAASATNTDGGWVFGAYTFLEENGGAVYVENGKATLSGGTVKNTHASKGGAFYVSGGEFEMNGGTIENSDATGTGGAVCVEKDGDKAGKATITMGQIRNVFAANGGALAVNGGEFGMSGGSIMGVRASSNGSLTDGNGGAVYVQSGTVNMSGGSIIGDETAAEAQNGGGVYIEGGSFTMNGGTMTNFNVSGNGGMVCVVGAGAQATVQGGVISGNTAASVNEAARGGAVYISAGKFTIDGSANIENCNATESGGGVYMESGSFTARGGAFRSCLAAIDGGGVYLGSGTFNLSDGELSDEGGCFEKCRAGRNGGAVCIMGGTAYISGGVIQGDNSADTGAQNELEAQNGGGIYIGGGKLEMQDGQISRCSAISGGAAYITGGECIISGGTVSHNHATDGGGMYVVNTPVTYGGLNKITVEFNRAVRNGGGMYIEQNSGISDKLTQISSGHIDNNTAGGFGGGIYHTGNKGRCVIGGSSSISENTAVNGGGLYIIGGSVLEVNGGHIYENTASGMPAPGVATAYDHTNNAGVGGGVYVGPGTTVRSNFAMSGEAVGIYSNTADFAAADVYADRNATVLSLPAVDDMKLTAELKATGWYCDYPTGDLRYNSDSLLNSIYFTGADKVQRYQDAAVSSDTSYYKVSDDLENIQDKYICLTIGSDIINYGTITISKSGSNDPEQYFVFRVKADSVVSDVLEKAEFEVSVKGNGSVTVTNVPYGQYTVTELDAWCWRYNVSEGSKTLTVSAENKDAQVSFVNSQSETLWLDGNSKSKLNIRGFAARSLFDGMFSW